MLFRHHRTGRVASETRQRNFEAATISFGRPGPNGRRSRRTKAQTWDQNWDRLSATDRHDRRSQRPQGFQRSCRPDLSPRGPSYGQVGGADTAWSVQPETRGNRRIDAQGRRGYVACRERRSGGSRHRRQLRSGPKRSEFRHWSRRSQVRSQVLPAESAHAQRSAANEAAIPVGRRPVTRQPRAIPDGSSARPLAHGAGIFVRVAAASRTGVPFPPYPGKGTPVGAGRPVAPFWRSISAVFR